MRKLELPKIKQVKNSNKQTIKHYKGWFSNTQNNRQKRIKSEKVLKHPK